MCLLYIGTVYNHYLITQCISPSTTKAACFPGNSNVLLESGGVKRLRDVRIGDSILSADDKYNMMYSKVIFIPHSLNYQYTRYTKLITDSGASILLTSEHLIFAGVCSIDRLIHASHNYTTDSNTNTSAYDTCTRTYDNEYTNIQLKLKPARDVQSGECAYTTSDTHSRLDRVVYKDDNVYDLGIYTVITTQRYIVINNILVSPYEYNHILVHTYYNVYRMLYYVYPKLFLHFSTDVTKIKASLRDLIVPI